MVSRITACFHPCFKTKLVLIFLPITYLVVILIAKSNNFKDNTKPNITIPNFCRLSLTLQKIFRLRSQQSKIPPKFVDDVLTDYITFKHDICVKNGSSDKLAVILVHSARGYFEERKVIRETYGSVKIYKNWKVVTLFLMGQSDYCLNMTGNISKFEDVSKEDESLKLEHSQFGDTIFGAFTDSYRNLTYKHLMGYKFVLERCADVDWVIKTDDDMFVNVTGILDQRNEELEIFSKRGNLSDKPSDIFCHQYNVAPARNPKGNEGKWFVTKKEWAEEAYPTFCLGNDYAISREWMEKIYSVVKLGGFLWIDDVFVMGKLRTLAEQKYKEAAKMRNIRNSVTDSRGLRNYVLDNCKNRTINFGMFAFIWRSEIWKSEMECLWERSIENVNPTVISFLKF